MPGAGSAAPPDSHGGGAGSGAGGSAGSSVHDGSNVDGAAGDSGAAEPGGEAALGAAVDEAAVDGTAVGVGVLCTGKVTIPAFGSGTQSKPPENRSQCCPQPHAG